MSLRPTHHSKDAPENQGDVVVDNEHLIFCDIDDVHRFGNAMQVVSQDM